MAPPRLTPAWLKAVGIGSFFRPRDLEPLEIPFVDLRRLVASGAVEKVGRGLYRLAAADITEQYSRAAVSARIPGAILCLLTALSYHDIGTQAPHQVWIAIPHKARMPRVPDFNVRVVRFSGKYLDVGVASVLLEGVPARITNPARTVVDCFRLRRLVGHDVALEAIKWAIRDRKATPAEICKIAKPCRADSLVGPYLELLQV
ncbi:MAG: type IV toxin-antitoxin system AbiEi family antitoxin domain-containing protein [Gammaproteobacteria bacterium]